MCHLSLHSTMAPRKCRHTKGVNEYACNSSDNEPNSQGTLPLPSASDIFHRHTHVESLNSKLTMQNILYTMPSSPGPSVAEAESIDNTSSDLLNDFGTNPLHSFASDIEAADEVENDDTPRVAVVKLSAYLACHWPELYHSNCFFNGCQK